MITPVSALLTDLYQLTMMQAYFERQMNDVAVFEFFARKLKGDRNFLVAAGLEQALAYLETIHFAVEELQWLKQRGFSAAFVGSLADLRFTGDVYAMPEGTIFFPEEPILRVVAPISQAQLVESRLINILQFQTLIASKAARTVLVAPGKLLVDFGMRRAHGAEAAMLAARASYLAGFSGTSNVWAGMEYGLSMYGTMAHSFIEAHADETTAFLDFARANPRNVVFLIDTYDTERGAERVVQISTRLNAEGIQIRGVRLDSGDLADHARRVRAILDAGGLRQVSIFASGNLDEWKVRELLAAGAPIDGFGIGTRLDVSADVPYLDCAYKLQEYAGTPRRKRSEGKATWPGRKQVFRTHEGSHMAKDIVALECDIQAGEPLLERVMKAGSRVKPAETLGQIRDRTLAQLSRLPEPLRTLERSQDYQVTISQSLWELAARADRAAEAV
jgi:nicotinate phosphoribosyltransferase